MPSKFEIAEGNVALEGALIDVDEATGRARKITRVREFLDHPK
jgi:calcineurin-like phosphoesterase